MTTATPFAPGGNVRRVAALPCRLPEADVESARSGERAGGDREQDERGREDERPPCGAARREGATGRSAATAAARALSPTSASGPGSSSRNPSSRRSRSLDMLDLQRLSQLL